MVLLPEDGELTLAELREVAAHQQQQIEAQQQLLVAKEQRLKFLKQQEARHHQGTRTAEAEILHQLRGTVEAQELKLRRLRLLQGQVEEQHGSNNNLEEELDSIRALFSEKEKQLSLAVAKVEELANQLDDLRRTSSLHSSCIHSSSELEKLRRELVYRTNLTEQQDACISQQRSLLSQRQQEIYHIDKKILELQQRLQRKCSLNQQLANQINSVSIVKQSHSSSPVNKTRHRPLSTNIATVEPLQRAPKETDRTQDDLHAKLHLTSETEDLAEFTPSKNDPKYQTLPYNTKFLMKGVKEQDDQQNHENEEEEDWQTSDKKELSTIFTPENSLSTSQTSSTFSFDNQSILSCKPVHSLVNFTPRPFGTTYSSSHLGPLSVALSTTRTLQSSDNLNTPSSPVLPVSCSLVAPCIPSQCDSPTVSTLTEGQSHVGSSSDEESDGTDAVENTKNHCSSSDVKITEGKLNLLRSACSDCEENCKPALPPKPIVPVKPVPPPRQIHGIGSGNNSQDVNLALSVLRSSGLKQDKLNYRFNCKPGTTSSPSTNARTPCVHNKAEANYQLESSCHESPEDSETIKRRHSPVQMPIRPKPLTIRKTPGLEPPRLKSNQLSGGELFKPKGNNSAPYKWPLECVNSTQSVINNTRRIEMPHVFLQLHGTPTEIIVTGDEEVKQDATDTRNEAEQSMCNDDQLSLLENQLDVFNGNVTQTSDLVSSKETPDEEDFTQVAPSSLTTGNEENDSEDVEESCALPGHQSAAFRRVKKGNLKTSGSSRNPRRVSFDPLALLLDAALEGELELVKKTAFEVPNPSAANDEGITALHNAICAGHFEIVTFLVEFGCDVNAQDSDGWTPLHCAASCNNLPMVKFLVEHGACIFATTLSDHETAAEKCEEDEEGFDGCSEYLYSIQEKLGVLNNGTVYSVYDYEAQNADELSFNDNFVMTVLRKGDDQEREWWWSQLNDREGYVPRNLLGLYPRVTKKKDG